jgi:diguanylate cyclase (GGDEF)-like protein
VRILIADDDPVSSKMLERALIRFGHEIVVVHDGPQAISALLAPDCPRMAILDWMMPGADGLEVCRTIRQQATSYVYLILLTARDRHEDLVAGLDSGADDFLTKPFNLDELRSRLRSGTRVLELQEGLLNAQEALSELATRDHLTGLWNRRMIVEHLIRELPRAANEKRPLAIALADVDEFKRINDTHGHPAGDVVLHEVAARMKLVLREYDTVGRYGGEEFLVVLPGCNAETGLAAAERVRTSVASGPVASDDGPLDVRVSIGVAWTDPGKVNCEDLIKSADEALYRAKTTGRNRVGL